MPLDADLQQPTVLRQYAFSLWRRVFHVYFGHGYITSLETPPAPETKVVEHEKVLSNRTHNICASFDNPKFRNQRLRAYYAIPKMVIIPSSSAQRKMKLRSKMKVADEVASREDHVKLILMQGDTKFACELILQWRIGELFDLAGLVRQLTAEKEYTAALRFSREFGLQKSISRDGILREMLDSKRYAGVLRQTNPRSRLVDEHLRPEHVLRRLVAAGHQAVALKYVHKFDAASKFPPVELVNQCLGAPGEFTVRSAALLLKYVQIFQLEDRFPPASIVEYATKKGILVHEMGNSEKKKYILKGSKRLQPTADYPMYHAPVRAGSAPN